MVTTETFRVPSISCGHCVAAITTELNGVPGVVLVKVDLDTKTVVVEHEGSTSAQLIAAIDEAGYEVAEYEVSGFEVEASD